MIELIYTTLTIFGFFLIIFFLFPEFQQMKVVMIFFQLIISIILLSNNFYKRHNLYEMEKYNNIQNLNFEPIISLNETYYDNGSFKDIIYETSANTEFSFIKTEKFSTKCLDNYYIQSNYICPITDIQLKKEKNNEYEKYIEINGNEYLYYTRENYL